MTGCPTDVAAKLDVSRETLERLEVYVDLLKRWNLKINLVSPKTIAEVWDRHILDSAQLLKLAGQKSGVWADLGSGGGFPGIVTAILSKEAKAWHVVLVESDQRKAAFLRTVARECNLDTRVVANRIEAIPDLNADAISARALAPLSKLLQFCDQHLGVDGIALFPKGAKAQEEVAEAREKWSFECEAMPSITDDAAVILKIGDVQRV